jgi:hypothetical protein
MREEGRCRLGVMTWVRAALGSAFVLFGVVCAWPSERARDPSMATVFVRVIGKVEIEDPNAAGSAIEERNVELGTGSGFLFTPHGHVLTNEHVVSGGAVLSRHAGRPVRIELTVERIEVVLPSGTRLDASIETTDATLDLAVLSVAGGDLPYLALGDSDAAEPGENVTVYGFPFGRDVELGRADLRDIVPTVSVTRGAMSAARADDAGNTAFLQTSATVNPGNSGGPMVDAEGFVLGVIRLKLKDGDGIGFAIPVNDVKDFLEVRGYLGLLGIERLRLAEEQTFEGKGITLRFPDSMEDRSPSRLRVASDPDDPIRFSSDRVASPVEISRLEEMLLGGSDFGGFRATSASSSSVLAGGRVIRGWASGQDERLEYVILDVGVEKVLVRYVGAAETLAFNRSAVRDSLASVQVEALLTQPIDAIVPSDSVSWAHRPLPAPLAPVLAFPEGRGWTEEVSAPFPCPNLPLLDSALAASPSGDFTVSLRAGWWRRGPAPVEAARACADRPARFGAGSYLYAVEWLGVAYTVSGRFERSGEEGLLQLEIVAPREKEPYVRDLGARFVEQDGERR